MRNWIIFFKERTPIASYLLITMGPATSGYALAHNRNYLSLFLAFIGFFLFFLVLRMMDEYKDYDKDVLAHPKRPLPRGLIALPEFKMGITIGLLALIGFDFLLLLAGYVNSFYLYSLVIVHLWLMYKEFYVAEWINARPILYAVTHQLILVTLCLYCISVYRNLEPLSFTRIDLVYSFSVLFAFFSYEVCRKLDPAAHPVLKTYLSVYGLNGVIKIMTTLLVLHLCAIHFLFQNNFNQYYFVIPIVLLFASLVALSAKKIKFKMVESMATLNLIVFLYSGIFYVISN
jgi:4-hydroxybenzoate polyprenyltransferase